MKSINWKYAFGEILIVIIGISIAFGLNNWASNSQDKKERDQYLINMISDVRANKLQLESNVLEIRKKIETCKKVLPLLGTDNPEKMAAIPEIFSVAQITNFESKDITYQTLINSGDLKLIDDFKLKASIEKHYSDYDIMLKEYERRENINKEYLADYFVYNIDYDMFSKGKFGFTDEKLLSNIYRNIQGSLEFKLVASEEGIKKCDLLINELNETLKN